MECQKCSEGNQKNAQGNQEDNAKETEDDPMAHGQCLWKYASQQCLQKEYISHHYQHTYVNQCTHQKKLCITFEKREKKTRVFDICM